MYMEGDTMVVDYQMCFATIEEYEKHARWFARTYDRRTIGFDFTAEESVTGFF